MREKKRATMKNRRSVNDQKSQTSPYRLPFFLVGAGVLMMVLGVFVLGWVWLGLLGFFLTIAAAFSIRLSFFGDWTPALYDEKDQGKDSLPPPPTMKYR